MITIDYNTRKVLAGKLWQYDYGQVLRIQGGNLNKVQEIQFALEETGADAMPRFGVTKDGVTDVVIPDVMLENNDFEVDYPFYVFIYNRDDASGETVEKFALNVLARSKPENFTAPEDTKLFQEAIKTVNESAERAEKSEQQAAEHAEQTKADAQKTTADRQEVEKLVESVSGIGEQVQAVKEYKDQAQTAATNALLSEQKSERAKELTLQAQAQAETAEGKAEQHALEAAEDKVEVERLATQVRQDKSSVEQTKTAVDKTAQDFTLTAQQALADVNNAGQTQSERVQQVGQDAIADVNTAKTQAVETVNATKTDAVKAVQTEGTKQTEAVQAKGQQILDSIVEIQVNNPSTTYTLQPNIQVVWGEVVELNLTLAPEKPNAINIYPFWFTSGATPTKVTLPATIILDGFVTKPNKKYCCQIEQNVLFWKEFEVVA